MSIKTPPSTGSPSNELPLGSALPGLEALAKVAKELHDKGLSPAEIKAALMKALAMNKAKRDSGKIPSKANLGKPGPMPE